MTAELAGPSHIPLILQLLRATPNPPNENEHSIQSLLDDPSQFISVDTDAPAICRIVKRPGVDFVDMPWWTWLGSGDMATKLLPVYGHVYTDFIAFHGPVAWPVGGSLPGFGVTDNAKRIDADARATAVQAMLHAGLPNGSVTIDRALNGVDAYLETTIVLLAQRAGV